MKKSIKISTAAVIAVAVALVSFMSAFALLEKKYSADILSLEQTYREKQDALASQYASFSKLYEIDRLFRELYIGDIDEDELESFIIAGYLYGTGDPYAEYYDEEAMKQLTSDLGGEVTGIGVQVIYNPDYRAIEIINVMPSSPALEAGIMIGDLIVNIGEDKQSVAELGYTAAVNMLRGEAGTEAVFTVARGEGYTESVEFRVARAKVTNISVMSHVYTLDPTVGVIKISEFDATTPSQFKAAVESLQAKGCLRLVIDVRYNPGGELNSICTVLDYLLPEGPVIRTEDKDGNVKTEYTSDADHLDMPINVIVNGSTASAAELFASALKDYGIAKLIGEKTYGKGCMQTIYMLPDGTGLKATVKLYNPPFSENYDGIGVFPDIEAKLDEAVADINPYKITDEEDNVLREAVLAFGE